MPDKMGIPSMTGGRVRIQIPASVAFDLGKFQRAIGNLVQALGCPTCFSGYDCTFLRETQMIVDPDTLKIDTLPLPDQPAIGTWPVPERAVTVTLPREVAFDLKKIGSVVKTTAGRLHHPTCHSGLDVTYRLERNFLVNSKTLGLESVSGGIVVDM